MSSRFSRTVWAFCAVAALSRCDCGSPVNADNSTVPGQCELEPPLLAAQKTDILFVIDNSFSMQQEQDAVADELESFVAALQAGNGLAQDFQVGVVTTSVYENARDMGVDTYKEYPEQSGKLRPVPSSGERVLRGDDPDLAPKFAELVRQGTAGSSQETPFEAVRLALLSPLIEQSIEEGGNGGFLRPGARLLIVTVGDEDDCSELPPRPPGVRIGTDPAVADCTVRANFLTPVRSYYELFRTLDNGRGQLREVLWATIGPVARTDKRAEEVVILGQAQNADCPTSYQAGYRIHEMASRFDPQLGNLDSICNTDYRQMLLRIADLANLGQSVEIMNTHDGALLQVSITRQNGTRELCTTSNGGIVFQARVNDVPARIFFQNQCRRQQGDQAVEVKLLCAG